MTDAIIVTVDSVRSRASTQETLLTLAVPQEYAAKVAKFLGMIHKPVAVAFAEVEQDGTPKKPDEKETKPFGKYAAELYRLGWFFNSKVLEAIGSDEEYLAWIEKQECCASPPITGKPHHHVHDGDVVAAHVRRVADGAGTGIKPKYSAIPLCHGHRSLQHQNGESAIGGKAWCDDQRDKHLVEWARRRLAEHFGVKSMGYVPPDQLRAWAIERNLEGTLPACYREG